MTIRKRPAALAVRALVVAGVVALAGCAETAVTVNAAKSVTDSPTDPWAEGRYKVGTAYEIAGRWYTPREDYEYEEVGMASWYGPKFHGRTTANGERFDQNALTAAHRTLPMPSMVRVTNLDNGRTVDLRINDRGPFANDRILDVSKQAAELLGFRRQGTARVRVIILPEQSLALREGRDPAEVRSETVRLASTRPAGAFIPTATEVARAPTHTPVPVPPRRGGAAPAVTLGATGWYVQAGAFSDLGNAREVADHLSRVGPTRITSVQRNGRTLTRVRVGPVTDGRQAARLLQAVQASGYPDARLVAN
ncbi:septal ring lytic transglycosylase RlpA family protein [Roseospira navarrensis]|uniref:Endolytic peptidoglycan transglycosylase RlpA n=1 Tax=Roseospira navarrensis TaxID=140058 RepID=A0A7X1ZGH4_9PROT|nr:septal ring lytic transglycosylase RlpA family protein [Roseospira navarrensis]MQX36977.1 septal ring lytic transglycosylase RlpA family protein [Roseospira navarrensis]